MSRTCLVLLSVLLVTPACTREPAMRPDCWLPAAVGELGSLCGPRNPEDLVHFRSADVVVAAEFYTGGAIVAFSPSELSSHPRTARLWPPDPPSTTTPEPRWGDPDCRVPRPETFHPHGLGSLEVEDGPHRLAVVAHGRPDTIQLFELSGAWPAVSLAWRGCVPFPPGATGNDVVLDPRGTIFATNWAPSRSGISGIYYLLKGSLGGTTGAVVRWDPGRGWRRVPGTDAALPNGIAFSAAERVLYVADGGRRRILSFDVSSEARPAAEPLAVTGNPDNVSLTSDGRVLTVSFNRQGDPPVLCLGQDSSCRVGWRVVALDPRTRDVQVLFEHDGSVVSMASSAVLIDEHLFIGSMADDRIGVRRVPAGGRSRTRLAE